MEIAAEMPVLTSDGETTTLGFEFKEGSTSLGMRRGNNGYLLVSKPVSDTGGIDYFDKDHYVEVNNQTNGRFGGLCHLNLSEPRRVQICLNFKPVGINSSFILLVPEELPTDVVAFLNSIDLRPDPAKS